MPGYNGQPTPTTVSTTVPPQGFVGHREKPVSRNIEYKLDIIIGLLGFILLMMILCKMKKEV